MVLTGGDGTIVFSPGKPSSEKQILEGKIAMDTLLLEIEEEQGYKRVHDRIEELKYNLKKYEEELKQIEEEEYIDSRNSRTKPYRWNWR